MKFITDSFAKLAILALILGCVLTVNYLQAAWSDPGASPTGGNTEPPINAGTVDQIKDASFAITGRFLAADGSFGPGLEAPDGSLTLDIDGAVGADEYCDGDGSICYDLSELKDETRLFGGMYSRNSSDDSCNASYVNYMTGGCTCPAYFTASMVANTGTLKIYYCSPTP